MTAPALPTLESFAQARRLISAVTAAEVWTHEDYDLDRRRPGDFLCHCPDHIAYRAALRRWREATP